MNAKIDPRLLDNVISAKAKVVNNVSLLSLSPKNHNSHPSDMPVREHHANSRISTAFDPRLPAHDALTSYYAGIKAGHTPGISTTAI